MAVENYMLDTNIASYLIKGEHTLIEAYLVDVPMSCIFISTITEAELLRGLAKKPEATRLAVIVKEFLLRVNILPWDSDAAASYARLKTLCENEGKSLGVMDMLIAAHSLSVSATLVTNDNAFFKVSKFLSLVDWTK